MPTTFYTETTCQRCGKVNRREGQCDGPPRNWLQGGLDIFNEAGVRKQHVWVDALCVDCGDLLLTMLGIPRKREQRRAEYRPIHCDNATCILARGHEGVHSGPATPPADTHEEPHEQPDVPISSGTEAFVS